MKESEHSYHKDVLTRLSKTSGHIEAIKRMVIDERDCTDILIQLSAVRAAINSLSRLILQEHISHCVVEAVENNDMKVVEDLKNAISKILK